jgi:hypothetical protein
VFTRGCVYGICIFPYTCEHDETCESRSCLPQRGSQIACDGICGDSCAYNLLDDCWNCGGEGDIIPPPCSEPGDVACLAPPDLFGTTLLDGSETDFDALQDEFALGGFADDESLLLARLRGIFDEQLYGMGVPSLSAPGIALFLLCLATAAVVLLRRFSRA